MRVVHPGTFYHEGRGPELQAFHVSRRGTQLQAIDYFLPDADHEPQNLRHLRFAKPQVYMVTPEEVENCLTSTVDWSRTGGGAMVSLGKSAWLLSFTQLHLEKCEHFRIMFYDQYIDVICEDVEVKTGAYFPGQSTTGKL